MKKVLEIYNTCVWLSLELLRLILSPSSASFFAALTAGAFTTCCSLFMSLFCFFMQLFLKIIIIGIANSVDPDQTAPGVV